MNLYEVNHLLSRTIGELTEVAIGQTFENKAIRVHRFSGSIRVTDLTNAGKRGKVVNEFALYDIDYSRDPKVLKLIEQFATTLHRVKNYRMALKMAEGIVDEAGRLAKTSERSVMTPKIETTQYKGVRVAVPGFKPIMVDSPDIALHADNESFRVTDKTDVYNEQTIIAPHRGKTTAVKKFMEWARKNQRKLRSMTFSGVTQALRKNGIEYHYYCAVD